MLATRVIPVLLKRSSTLVKGERFNSWRSVGVAMQAARVHAARAVDELIILDIGATSEGRSPDFAAIKELTRDCFCPLTVGGGVRNVEDVRQLLAAGADRVAICSGLNRKGFLMECVTRFGSQAIVAAIDSKYGFASRDCGLVNTIVPVKIWASQCAIEGAGEILLQSIDRDGTMQGYDLEMIRSVSSAVDIPVIACGGCSGPEDMLNAIKAGASAVAAGALFQFTDHTPRSCSEYLATNGIETRITA